MDRAYQRNRFESVMADSGMISVPDEDLPENWDSMSPKQQTSWLSNHNARNNPHSRTVR